MTRSDRSITWDDLKLDVGYLAEELMAFKRLVEWIPFDERPLGQQSITDMLGSVQRVQRDIMVPLITDWQKTLVGGITINGSPALRELVFAEDSERRYTLANETIDTVQPEQEETGPVLELLDDLIATRQNIMDLLHLDNGDVSEKRIVLNGHVISFTEVVQAMIRFERSELRKIGERIQAMETDRRG